MKLGWVAVLLATAGSFAYSAAVLAAVEFGGFFVRLVDRDLPHRSVPAIFFEILAAECRVPLAVAGVLTLTLLLDRVHWRTKSDSESTLKADEQPQAEHDV